jgi:hypothetical protein
MSWPAEAYPIIFHEILREGGGHIPEDMMAWTYASARNRWFAFARTAARHPQLGQYARGRRWRVTQAYDGGLLIEMAWTADEIARQSLGESI